MELRHDYFGCRYTFFFVDTGWDAATIIAHSDRSVGVQDNVDAGAVASQGFIDGVIQDLIDHMVKPGTIRRIAYVHSRAFAYGIKPAQDFDGVCSIFLVYFFW
jgi:hypothetical protein